LQDARAQPFLDEAQHPAIRNSVLEELHQPSVVDRIEERLDTLPTTATTRIRSPSRDSATRSMGKRWTSWHGRIDAASSTRTRSCLTAHAR
jgi:hypothetical protein